MSEQESEATKAGTSAASVWKLPTMRSGDTPAARARAVAKEQEKHRAQAWETGYAEGIAAAETEVRKRLATLDGLLATLDAPLATLDESVGEALVDLSFRIARQVIRRELQIDRTQVVAIVRDAIQALPIGARNVRVHMHPADAQLVGESLAQIKLQRSWELVEDPLLTRGGCRIVTDSSTVDAQVEKRLQRILAHLVEDERQTGRDPNGDD